jgi:hypothetical protein
VKKWTAAALMGGAAVVALSASAPQAALAQNKFPDVPPGHWAHEAVEDLADAGLVLGYPDGRFLGSRTLTRYEMATIIKRVVDNLAQRQPAQGAAGATPEQLAEVRRLVDEFKAELTVIGADLAAVKTQLEALQNDTNALKEGVEGLKDVTAGQRTELDTLNQARTQTRVDGYVQARYVARGTRDARRAPEGSSPDTSRGLNGNTDTFNVRRARINIRGDVSERAAYRVQLDAGSSAGSSSAVGIKEAYVTVKNLGLASLPGFAQLTGGIGDGKFFTTQDLTLGQQVTPFGHLLQYSSSSREVPERYIAFSDNGAGLFPDQDYDKGVSLNGAILGKLQYQLGLYNGTGVTSNDLGRRKDFIGRIGVALAENWDLGISGYDGEGNNIGTTLPVAAPVAGVQPSGTTPPIGPIGFGIGQQRRRVRSLVGFDTQYYFPFAGGGALKFEYVRGKGGLSGAAANTVTTALKPYVDGATVEGYYAQLSKNLGKSLVLVGAYEYFNRNADPADSGALSTFGSGEAARRVRKGDFAEERAHVGALYFLDPATRFRLWYEAPLNFPNPPGGPEGGSGTNVTGRSGQYTAEIQVKF